MLSSQRYNRLCLKVKLFPLTPPITDRQMDGWTHNYNFSIMVMTVDNNIITVTVESPVKDTPYYGHNTKNLCIKDKLSCPKRYF